MRKILIATFFAFVFMLTVPSGVLAKGADFQVETVTNDGFGDPNNMLNYNLASYNGKIYSSIVAPNGVGSVWASSTGDPGSWTISGQPGMGDLNNNSAVALANFNGYLYATFLNYNGLEIWRTDATDTWECVVCETSTITNGFGDPGNALILFMQNYNNQLWAYTMHFDSNQSYDGLSLWVSGVNDTSNWIQVDLPYSYSEGSFSLIQGFVFNDTLFAEISIQGQTELWYLSNIDPVGWTQVGGTFASNIASSNQLFFTVDEINDLLYVGTYTGSGNDAQLWYSYSIKGSLSDFEQILTPNLAGYYSAFPVATTRGVFVATFNDTDTRLFRVSSGDLVDTGITFNYTQFQELFSAFYVATQEFSDYVYVGGGGNTAMIIRIPLMPITNTPTFTEATDGSGLVQITFTVADVFDGNGLRAKVEYCIANVCHPAFLSDTVGEVLSTYDDLIIENTNENGFQISPISTSGGANTVRVVWRSKHDFDNQANSGVVIKITLTDGDYLYDLNGKPSNGGIVDNLKPDFVSLNVTNGQVITTNPYVLKAKATDLVGGVAGVKFYVDGNLICTVTTTDANGDYVCNWDTSVYHSDVQITLLDSYGNSSQSAVYSTTVNLQTLSYTGDYVLEGQFLGLVLIFSPLLFLVVRKFRNSDNPVTSVKSAGI